MYTGIDFLFDDIGAFDDIESTSSVVAGYLQTLELHRD